MAVGAGFTAYRTKVGAALADKGFDPTTIIALLMALLPLITSLCTPKSMRRRFGNRARLTVAIMQALPDLTAKDAFKAADLHFDIADKASDEELQAFIDDCCSDK